MLGELSKEELGTREENFHEGSAGFSSIGTKFKLDRKSTRLNSSHITRSRMPSSA